MIEFDTSGNNSKGSYEIKVFANEDYNTSKANITIIENSNYNINVRFEVCINDSVVQQLGPFNLFPGINYYSFDVSFEGSKDTNVKVKITSNANAIFNEITQEDIIGIIPKKEAEDLSASYNKKYDKITDKEVTNDFASKICMGKSIYNADNQLIDKNQKLITYISNLCMSNPLPQQKDLYLFRFNINKGCKSISATVLGDVSKYKVYRAYADKSGLDISELFNVISSNGKFYAKADFDTAYPTNDIISLLLSTN